MCCQGLRALLAPPIHRHGGEGASASQARSRAQRKPNKGYGVIVAARRANANDARLIRRVVWVRRRRDGSSSQFGLVRSKARARRQRSRYRRWLRGAD